MSEYDPISVLQGHGYVADSDAVRALGQLSVGAERLKTTCGTTYIRTLVRYAQDSVGIATDLTKVGAAHEVLYPYIVEGVTTDDVKSELATSRSDKKARALERNSRSNFARTAYYSVARFISEGGILSDIDVTVTTKALIVAATDRLIAARKEREAVVAPTPAPAPAPVSDPMAAIDEAYNSLMAAIRCYPRASDTDRAALEFAIESMVRGLECESNEV